MGDRADAGYDWDDPCPCRRIHGGPPIAPAIDTRPRSLDAGPGLKNEAVGHASSRLLEVHLAGDRGFEPRLSDSESDVLPLDESPMRGDHSSIEVGHGQTLSLLRNG